MEVEVLGTQFRPRRTKVKGQELENWLATQFDRRIDFKIYELVHQDKSVVVFAIQPSPDRPVSFRGIEYVRVGSYTKKLCDHPRRRERSGQDIPKFRLSVKLLSVM